MSKSRYENQNGVFYCVVCGSFGTDEQGHPIGTPFECPNDKSHFAEVVKPSAGEFWLRMEQRIWSLQERSPLHLLPFGGRAGLYHGLRFLILMLTVFFATPDGS